MLEKNKQAIWMQNYEYIDMMVVQKKLKSIIWLIIVFYYWKSLLLINS
jgi:hypothetical protein